VLVGLVVLPVLEDELVAADDLVAAVDGRGGGGTGCRPLNIERLAFGASDVVGAAGPP
jgi:hypothetical protein